MPDATEPRNYHLSWQGLRVPIQKDWRPLRIEGDHDQGNVTAGDAEGPVFQLRWLRVPEGYDAENWIEKRKIDVAAGQCSPEPPCPNGFDTVDWIRDLSIREECEKTVWWGHSETGRVMVEVLLTGLCAPKLNQWFLDRSLPALQAFAPDEPWLWEIFSTHFVTPVGYKLKQHRLATGDMAFEFVRKRRERLLVRQVYPAGLALQRRTLPGWLRDRPFKESRRIRVSEEQAADDGRLLWTGWKRLPFPLGWIFPQQWEALIVRDEAADRLLMAEREWRRANDGPGTDELVSTMLWSAR